MHIVPETPDLEGAIRALLLETFPGPAEADLVERLRCDGDIAFARAAMEGDAVVGHVVLSPMRAPMKALGLGPVATAPRHRRQGIGSRLIRDALGWAKQESWEAVFVLGEPGYYTRFGFDADAARGFASPYAGPYFMVLALQESQLAVRTGRVDYANAFRDLE